MIQFVELVDEELIEKYGCGAEPPLMAVCDGCLSAYTRDVWQVEKVIGGGTDRKEK